MPGGKAHAFATLAATCATPFIVNGLAVGATPTNAAAATAGCLLGVLITPDLDVNHGCAALQAIRRAAGEPIADLWRTLWYPYAIMVPHRSWISHLPLLGTALRLGYLYLAVFLIMILLGAAGLVRMPQVQLSLDLIRNSNYVWAFAGLALADLLHFGMDRFFRNR